MELEVTVAGRVILAMIVFMAVLGAGPVLAETHHVFMKNRMFTLAP
jgi:hypothetical protein